MHGDNSKKKIQTDVAVICTVYNHEKFLRNCLDGLVNQQVNFEYKVVVHDDCSTDHSIDIIREYVKKYSEIIVPIYEDENQYSKGKSIIWDIIVPLLECRYVAFCEGDDYWCDNEKLFRQFNFMEQNQGVSMCTHNTRIHDLRGQEQDRLFNKLNMEKRLSQKDVFLGWNVHTSSYFLRSEVLESAGQFSKYWFGDYVILLSAYAKGNVFFLPEEMSVYNACNTEGLTWNIHRNNIEMLIENELLRIDFLREYNGYTKDIYSKIIKRRIYILKKDLVRACLRSMIRNVLCIAKYKKRDTV